MGGLFSLLDRITSWLPINTKEERLRNTIDKLEKQQKELTEKSLYEKDEKRKTNIMRQLIIIDHKLSKFRNQAKNR